MSLIFFNRIFTNKLFILIAIAGFCTACNTSQKEVRNSSIKDDLSLKKVSNNILDSDRAMSNSSMYKVDSLKLRLDATTPAKSTYIQYLADRNELAMMNPSMNTINVFDLDRAQLKKKIVLKQNGPNGVGDIRSFNIQDNFVYVLNTQTYKFYQLDTAGNVLEKYDLSKDGGSKAKGSTRQPIIIDWPLAIMCSTPYKSLSSTDLYESEDLLTLLNLETKEINYFLSYPKEVKGHLWGPNLSDKFYTYNAETKKLVVSWPPTSVLSETDLKTIKNYDAPSITNIKVNPVKVMPTGYKETHAIYIENPQYSYIFYDQFKKCYYRMVAQEVPERFRNDNDFDKSNLKPFSIMVLDLSFQTVKEIEFPHLTYYNYMTFVTEEGLWMARIPENEDELVFDCFSF